MNGVESSQRQAYACQPIDRLKAGFSCGWQRLKRLLAQGSNRQAGWFAMLQASTLFTRLEFRLAERLFHNHWLLPRSPRTQRLTMRLFKRCAEAGHPDALSVYGHMLFHRSQTPQDKARGARYVLEAAHAGDVRSQYQVAQIHEHGCAQYPRREDYAVTWYARAAQSGHFLAAERLARAYRLGELGLTVDDERAAHWQRQAEQMALGEAAVA